MANTEFEVAVLFQLTNAKSRTNSAMNERERERERGREQLAMANQNIIRSMNCKYAL